MMKITTLITTAWSAVPFTHVSAANSGLRVGNITPGTAPASNLTHQDMMAPAINATLANISASNPARNHSNTSEPMNSGAGNATEPLGELRNNTATNHTSPTDTHNGFDQHERLELGLAAGASLSGLAVMAIVTAVRQRRANAEQQPLEHGVQATRINAHDPQLPQADIVVDSSWIQGEGAHTWTANPASIEMTESIASPQSHHQTDIVMAHAEIINEGPNT